jgi:hypothetical protein
MAVKYTKSGAIHGGTEEGRAEIEMAKKEAERTRVARKLQDSIKERLALLKEEGKFADFYSGRMEQSQKIQEVLNKDGSIREGVNLRTLQHIEKQVDEMESVGDRIKDTFPLLENVVSGFEDMVDSVQSLIGKFGLVLGVFIMLAKLAFEFAKAINEARADFGILTKDAVKLVVSLKAAEMTAKRFMIDSETFGENFTELVNQLGQANSEMAFFNVQFSRTLRNSGIQAEDGAEFLSILMSQAGVSKELALTELDRLASLARMEQVAPAQIFADLEKELIKAASAARKLGFEFGSIVELGDALLDVTDRINKEQQLSLILGRQVSLQRVAALHAQGKVDAAQRELASQLRGFGGLSALQQRQASGILGGGGVAELRKMLGLLEDMNTGINKGNRQYMMTQSN